MQEKTPLSPDSLAQPTAANSCRSCDKSTLTSSKLIRRQADCWQLIILATPMSRGMAPVRKVVPVLPSSFSLPALLSYCWPSTDELGVNPAMLFIYFLSSSLLFFEKFVIQRSVALFCRPCHNRWCAQGYLLNRSIIISLTYFKAFPGVDRDLKSILAQQG